jgi:hypothetical protein
LLGRDEVFERRFDAFDPVGGRVDLDVQLGGQLRGGRFDLVVEVRPDPSDGQRADRDRERAQDRERQQRRDARQARADRQPVERGVDAADQAPWSAERRRVRRRFRP